MTLIAVHAAHDHAEIVADTLAYTRTQRRLGRASKVHTLPHVDAAVATHGSLELANHWAVHAGYRAHAVTFDDLTDQATDALSELWRDICEMNDHRNAVHGASAPVPRSIALAVGYSHRQDRFRAVAHSSEDGFEPVDLDGLWVIPSPLNVRPSDLEQRRIEQTFEELFDDASPAAALRNLPRPVPPTTPDQWADLARTVRQQRALIDLYSGLKTYVGGDAILTRLERGASSTRTVHTFDDTGTEFATMMRGSLHPAGQRGPCPCDSGRPFGACCLTQITAGPCPCGRSATFGDCCRVEVAARVA